MRRNDVPINSRQTDLRTSGAPYEVITPCCFVALSVLIVMCIPNVVCRTHVQWNAIPRTVVRGVAAWFDRLNRQLSYKVGERKMSTLSL